MARAQLIFKASTIILSVAVGLPTSAAIFGVDDRIMISPQTRDYSLARSTAVAVLNTLINETSSARYEILTDSTKDFLCKDEKFYNKPSLSYACSGFLVAPDLLVTAGHCMTNIEEVRNEKGLYCESYSSWVFDYAADSKGQVNTTSIPADNHYKCKQIVYAISDKENDFALIQLDRPVKGRKPLKLSSSEISGLESLKMIGHPLGLPSVLSKNARVIKNDLKKKSFVTTLDAFVGNSGSAVFNQNNEVVGILISGTPANNMVLDKANKCERFNHCDESTLNCLLPDEVKAGETPVDVGSDVQRLSPLLKIINEFEKARKQPKL